MRRRISQSCLALLATVVLLLAAGSAPAGAAGWVGATPPANAANGPSGAALAVAPMGDAIAAWTDDDHAGTQTLMVAWRPAGGAWSAPQPLVRRMGVDALAVAMDAAGDGTLVWVDSDDGVAYAAHAARWDRATGLWSAPHDFAPGAPAYPRTQVRADASGNVVAAWLEHDAAPDVAVVRAAVWSGGAWSAPATLSDPADASANDTGTPQIAPDASGGALVAWTAQRIASPGDFAIQTATHLGGGAWSAPGTLLPDTGDRISPVRLAGLAGGDVAASWTQDAGPELMGAYRQGGGAWNVDLLSADVALGCNPVQALGDDDGGGATVVWKAASTFGLEAVRLTRGGPEPGGTVFDSDTETAVEATIDRGTVVLIAHDDAAGVDSALATRRAGGGWSAPALLRAGDPGMLLTGPRLRTDAAGNQLATWIAKDTMAAQSIEAAAYLLDPPVDRDPPIVKPPPPPRDSDDPDVAPLRTPAIGGARDGVLLLARGTRALHLTVRNPNGRTLRGRATLVRPRAGRRAALALADRRKLAFAPGSRALLTLRLTDRALRALRAAPGHRLRVTLTLTLRAPDGRRVSARRTLTLDAARHFGARSGGPSARTAC